MLLHIFLACQWPQHRHCKDGCDSKWRTLAIWSSGVRGKKLNNSKTSWHTSQTALNWPLLMSCFSDSPQSFSLQLDRKTVQGNMRFVFSSPSRYTIPLQRFMWFFFFSICFSWWDVLVLLQGGREVADFLSYLKREATNPVVAEEDEKKPKKKKKSEL